MTDQDLDAIERRAAQARALDLGNLDEEDAREVERALDEIPWLVAEVRRLRRDPGRLGALLRLRRIEKGLSPEELARDASLREEAGSVPISAEEVRALEEGTKPTGPRWPDVLAAIAGVLGIPRDEIHD